MPSGQTLQSVLGRACQEVKGVAYTLHCVVCSYGHTCVSAHCKEAGMICFPHSSLIATDDVPDLLIEIR